jgi:hypothetical protein
MLSNSSRQNYKEEGECDLPSTKNNSSTDAHANK